MTGSSRVLPQVDTNASELLRIFKHRRTAREFSERPLDSQLLSELLWAAYGINRSTGERTAPSAHNTQSIDVYVADTVGLFLYNARAHALDLVQLGDIRSLTGLQIYAAEAPTSLVFVHDERRLQHEDDADTRLLLSATGAGAIAENVYLFCAGRNLNAGVRADIDRPALAKAMRLTTQQRILLAQAVGYPPVMQSIRSTLKNLLGRT